MLAKLFVAACPAAMFLWSFRNLPAPADGWRGGLGRFAQSAILAGVVYTWAAAVTGMLP